MSFLLDPPALVVAGAVTEVAAPGRRSRSVAELGIVGLFVTFSIGLYLDKPPTLWLARLFRARSGRDWMINSGVTDFEYEDPGIGTHLLGGAIFATYPLWFRLGRRLGARLGQTSTP